jgi:hypothetical protein
MATGKGERLTAMRRGVTRPYVGVNDATYLGTPSNLAPIVVVS